MIQPYDSFWIPSTRAKTQRCYLLGDSYIIEALCAFH